MDKLEQFIIDNKDQFEQDRMPEVGWDRLNKRLDTNRSDWSIYWKIAAMFFLTSTIVLAYFLSNKGVEINVKAANTSIDGTFETFYISQIHQKIQEYNQLVGDVDREELLSDLADFDSAYVDLSKSFERLGSQELAEAMLENLRLRIFILNEQIELLKQGKGGEESFHSS